MGDISRHRDIFLFTRESVSAGLLDAAKIGRDDLSYLELGNYLTDVSQFRDPVTYIFAKQRIWREKVIPRVADKVVPYRAGAAAVAGAGIGLVTAALRDWLGSGTGRDLAEGGGAVLAAAGGILAALPSDAYADLGGADEWIDALLGTPLGKIPVAPGPAGQTAQARARRDDLHYGYMGRFFQHFIEGMTQMLFATDVPNRASGEWGSITAIPDERVTQVYAEFFTQYWPHEHTDQPPYVWDASKRPSRPQMYGPSRRQASLRDGDVGVMNAVDVHYVGYLADGLAAVETEWRALRPDDTTGRQRLLVRAGKLLHGVEDWFFHSNVVELLAVRGFRPEQGDGESDEDFLQRFVAHLARTRPEFVDASPAEKVRLQRVLHRRLRFPAYDAATRTQSGGRLSESRMSTPSLRHAYPAFPSSDDTSHTLLHALEHLEYKASGEPGQFPSWLLEWMRTRGIPVLPGVTVLKPVVMAQVERELRDSMPLLLTLLSENERQRLVANVDPQHWPAAAGATPTRSDEDQVEAQTDRHARALQPRMQDSGRTENNYAAFVRFLFSRGHLNASGQQALLTAFDVDRESEAISEDAPGAGGVLIQFAVERQKLLDEGDAAMVALNRSADSIHGRKSDNGAFNEIVGSHSLMSKDTVKSVPFFEDARVLAAVASSSVFTILLQQVALPATGSRVDWVQVLHHLIRFPPRSQGWERQALALAEQSSPRRIPTIADLPELQVMARQALRSGPPAPPRRSGREDLEQLYTRLEMQLADYRYP